MKIKIGEVLQEQMKEKKLSLRQLAKKSGVPVSTLSEWSTNRPPKNPLQTKRVAEVLGISLNYLLFGEEDLQEPILKTFKEDFFQGTFEISVKRVRVK